MIDYRIKDRITPDIKKAFLEEIKKTRDSGKEEGFLLCLNDDGTLYASEKRCTGSACGFNIKDAKEYCPDAIQGAFHTHPFLINIERFYGRKPTQKEIKDNIKLYKKHFDRERITLTTPSHHDLADTLVNQCVGESEGTVCTGNDLELEKVECWTVKANKIKIEDCSHAKEESKERIADKPRKWIKPLFEREIINLRDKKFKFWI